MRDLASEVTALANQTGQQFPYVTVPAWETLGESVRRKAGLEALYLSMMLETPEELQEWSTYSMTNQDWLEQSRATAATSTYGEYNPQNYQTGSISPVVYTLDENGAPSFAFTREPPYAPIWHASPPPFNPAFINFDSWPTGVNIFGAVSAAREGLYAWPEDLSGFGELVVTVEDHDTLHANLVDYVRDGAESAFDHPHSLRNEPVFEIPNDRTSKIVGYIIGLVPWDRYLIDLLPDGVSGITCVLKAAYQCNQEDGCKLEDIDWWPGNEQPQELFTYALNGNSAFYLGKGVSSPRMGAIRPAWQPFFFVLTPLSLYSAMQQDMHETAYNDMEVVIPFSDYGYLDESSKNVSYQTAYR